ncbi:hypothetical protein [Tardiphaga sp.]|jgi:hypothetical protein|uniref:hypothetical protein n=1 Tax=Tardiphaga sp. TaxID=1926292 RepID=UPI0037D9C60C
MRFASLILAVALMVAGPSLAGSADGGLPHVGSFTFHGTSVVAPTVTAVALVR